MKIYIYSFFLLYFISEAYAGPLSYGICQTGCNALIVSCYAAAGFTFGTITVGLGTCMAGCVAAGFAPTL